MCRVLKIIISSLIFSSVSLASEYVVIANKTMKNISKAQIKAIYLKKITVIDEITVVPLSLPARDSLRKKFEQDILKMNFSRLKFYWAKQHYKGLRPPISMKSQQSILSFVKKVEGAIGYIDANNLDESVKVIYRWED